MNSNALRINNFSRQLLAWYDSVKRDLPWRNLNDPYKVWVSEIILQQTRVEQGRPYFDRFIETFPDIFSLANASEQQVLKSWEGLGYYSRARNMHKCAGIIAEKFQGKFPDCFEDLLELPGIGRYTAAAIASFSFKKAIPAIDGNVIRVLTRLFRISEDPFKANTSRILFGHSKKLISKKHPDLYNQAMMELGSMVCKPHNPACGLCPVSEFCEAKYHGDPLNFPGKKEKIKVRKRYFNYVILKSGDKTYLQPRSGNDIWKGLYEFVLVESNKRINVPDILDQIPAGLLKEPEVIYESREIKHSLSHQEIRARFIEVDCKGMDKVKSLKRFLYDRNELDNLPKSVLINKYLEERAI